MCVSIDTRHPQVALEALSAGASIINDVTGFTNEHMFDIAKNCDAGLVVMHNSRGVEVSGDIVAHATEFLRTKTLALTAAGVEPAAPFRATSSVLPHAMPKMVTKTITFKCLFTPSLISSPPF